jgi:hypothetical protein
MRSLLMSFSLGAAALGLLGVFTPDANAWHRRVVVVPATTYYVAPAPVLVAPPPPPPPVVVAQPVAPVVVRYRPALVAPFRPRVVYTAPAPAYVVPGPYGP